MMFDSSAESILVLIIVLELAVPLSILAYLYRRGVQRNRKHIR